MDIIPLLRFIGVLIVGGILLFAFDGIFTTSIAPLVLVVNGTTYAPGGSAYSLIRVFWDASPLLIFGALMLRFFKTMEK